jgi:DNA-directed RNA polymerase specialized sigma24 family protein
VADPTNLRDRLFACYERAFAYALTIFKSPDRAREATQAAFTKALGGGSRGGQKWDGKADPFVFVCGIIKNERQTLHRERAREASEEEAPISGLPTSSTPERLLTDAKDATPEWVSALRAELEGDAMALAVLDLYEEGVVKRSAQVERLSAPLDEVKKARKRVSDATKRVRAALARDAKKKEGVE